MQNFNNLKVYEETKALVIDIYNTTKFYPKEEVFGLVQQMRRSAVSIGANIAEGTGRMSDADFRRFLYISIASLKELEYYIDISKELNYLDANEYERKKVKIKQIAKMLNSLIEVLTV